MEVHRIPLALRPLPRIRQRVICFHLRECARYEAWAGMQAFVVFPCIKKSASWQLFASWSALSGSSPLRWA